MSDAWASPGLAAQAAYLLALDGETLELDGVFAVRSGIASNAENGVVGTGRARPDVGLIARLTEWFGEAGVPASWLCGEGPYRAAWIEALVAAGWTPEREAWEMQSSLAALDLDPWPSADVRIRQVEMATDMQAWAEVAEQCGWFETAAQRDAVVALNRRLGPAFHFYVAWSSATPVAMASVFFVDELVLLNAVAVVEPARRRGIARALTHARLQSARARGCRLAVLAPTADGAALHQALGFETRRQPPDRCCYLTTRSSRPPSA